MLRMLLDYLRIGSGGTGDADDVVTGYRRPLGYVQIVNASLASATLITPLPTPPAGFGLRMAIIQCNGGVVRWRDDQTAPTASIGMSIPDGGELDYVGDITKIQFIASSGTPILDISLYD